MPAGGLEDRIDMGWDGEQYLLEPCENMGYPGEWVIKQICCS